MSAESLLQPLGLKYNDPGFKSFSDNELEWAWVCPWFSLDLTAAMLASKNDLYSLHNIYTCIFFFI